MPLDVNKIDQILQRINTSGFKEQRADLNSLLKESPINLADIFTLMDRIYDINVSSERKSMAKYLLKLADANEMDLLNLDISKLKFKQLYLFVHFVVNFCMDQVNVSAYLSRLMRELNARMKESPKNEGDIVELIAKIVAYSIRNDVPPNEILSELSSKMMRKIIASKPKASPLHSAIKYKSRAWIKYLISNFSFLIHEPDRAGVSPLILAMQENDHVTAEELVKREASVFDKDQKGISALDYAKKMPDRRLYKLFFSKQFSRSAKEQTWFIAKPKVEVSIDQSELDVIKRFVKQKLERLNENSRFYKYAQKYARRVPFKIPREVLNEFQRDITVEHSFLMLPGENGEWHMAAMLRGTFENEGIVGHGVLGKVVPIMLEIDGVKYCVKVSSSISQHEREIMQALKIKHWFFKRSNKERQAEKQDWADSAWISSQSIDEKSYIIQRYIPGVPLQQILEKVSDLDENSLLSLKIAFELTRSLQAMHELGVAHKDLHPGNALVYYDEHKESIAVEIIDFDRAVKDCMLQDKMDDIVSLLKIMLKLGLQDVVSDLGMTLPLSVDAAKKMTKNVRNVLPKIMAALEAKLPEDSKNILQTTPESIQRMLLDEKAAATVKSVTSTKKY